MTLRLVNLRNVTGFTLVELQIALLILVLIGAVLMGGLQLSAKSINSAEKLNQQSNDIRVIARFLTQQITGITPLTALSNGQSSVIFKGDHHSIYYTGQLPRHVVTGGPWLIHLYVKDKQLRLAYKVLDNNLSFANNVAAEFASLTLLTEVDEFTVFYQQAASTIWQTSWQNPDILPMRIKIQIKQDHGAWPELIVAIPSFASDSTPFNVVKMP